MVTPTAGNVRGGIQSLTIETGSQKQHPSQILTTGATSPANAANNPQLRYKAENNSIGMNSGAMMGIHHPQSTKNQNTRQFNLKRSLGPGGKNVGQSNF